MTTIVVADDNPVSRELIHEILKSPDRLIIEASDGRDALLKIEETNPDLVLLDIQMPALDGFGVLQQLRSDPRFRKLRVAALTAFAMKGDQERALAAGFDEYITKPVRSATLRAMVEKLLSVDL